MLCTNVQIFLGKNLSWVRIFNQKLQAKTFLRLITYSSNQQDPGCQQIPSNQHTLKTVVELKDEAVQVESDRTLIYVMLEHIGELENTCRQVGPLKPDWKSTSMQYPHTKYIQM